MKSARAWVWVHFFDLGGRPPAGASWRLRRMKRRSNRRAARFLATRAEWRCVGATWEAAPEIHRGRP